MVVYAIKYQVQGRFLLQLGNKMVFRPTTMTNPTVSFGHSMTKKTPTHLNSVIHQYNEFEFQVYKVTIIDSMENAWLIISKGLIGKYT